MDQTPSHEMSPSDRDQNTTVTFEDGTRVVDMMLAYETCSEDNEGERHKVFCRQFFMDGLVKRGLELEEAKSVSVT